MKRRIDLEPFLIFLVSAILIWHLVESLPGGAQADPQPRLEITKGWSLLEPPDGVQWYVRDDAIFLIQGLPEKHAEKTGHRTIIHLTGGQKIRSPYPPLEVFEFIIKGPHDEKQHLPVANSPDDPDGDDG